MGSLGGGLLLLGIQHGDVRERERTYIASERQFARWIPLVAMIALESMRRTSLDVSSLLLVRGVL